MIQLSSKCYQIPSLHILFKHTVPAYCIAVSEGIIPGWEGITFKLSCAHAEHTYIVDNRANFGVVAKVN